MYEADEKLLKHYDMAKLYENSEFSERYEDAELLLSTDLTTELSKVATRYQSLEEIGRGGMKRVIRALDTFTNREVALATQKSINSEESIENFLREARLTASLQHQNIMPVYDLGVDMDGRPFFTMKLIEGENLHEILKKIKSGNRGYKSKYNLRALINIYLRICDAISYAHSKNIVHLDLKPQNIQVSEHGEVLVCDWGIAQSLDYKHQSSMSALTNLDNREATLDSFIKGTPGYMAPEQALGDYSLFSKKTDVYALGAILYTILSLEKPCESGSVERIIDKTINGDIIIPSYIAPERNVPDALERICLKCLELDPVDRYISVKKLSEDMHAWEEGFLTSVEDPTFLGQLSMFYKRNHRFFFGVAAVIFFFLLVVALFMLLLVRSTHKAEEALFKAEVTLEELKKSEHEKGRLSKDASVQILREATESLEKNEISKALNSIRYALDLNPSLSEGWRLLAMIELLNLNAKAAFENAKKSKDHTTIDVCSDVLKFSNDVPEVILGELWNLAHLKKEKQWKNKVYEKLKKYHTSLAADEVLKMLKVQNRLDGVRMKAEIKNDKLSLILMKHKFLKDI